ncbi:DUF6150 family protein [Desulfoluna limicola]
MPLKGSAEILVHEVASKGAADLLVCKVYSRNMAEHNDGLWCDVHTRSLASSRIKWVDNRNTANLLICYVNNRSMAGWQIDHRLRGKL